MDMFDQVIETRLVQPDPEEVVAAVADLVHSWRRFRDLDNSMDAALDLGRRGINWWKALDQLALADSRLKEAFICGDRSPASIRAYDKFRRKMITGERYRADA